MRDIYKKIGSYSPMADSVLFNAELSGNEKILYQLIQKLSDNDKNYCYCSRAKLAEYMGISPRTIDRLLNALRAGGYITKEYGVSWRGRREIRLSIPEKIGVVMSAETPASLPAAPETITVAELPAEVPAIAEQAAAALAAPVDKSVHYTLTDLSTYSGHGCQRIVDTGVNRLINNINISKDQEKENLCEEVKNKEKNKKTDKERLDFHTWFTRIQAVWNEELPEKRYNGNSMSLIYTALRDLLTICERFNDTEQVIAAIKRYKAYHAAPIERRVYGKRHEYSGFISFLEFGLEIFISETILDELLKDTAASTGKTLKGRNGKTFEERQKEREKFFAEMDALAGKKSKEVA